MKTKKKSEKRIGKMNPILYHILYPIVKLLYTKKYNISYDNKVVREIKGPAIVLGTHTSDVDHIISAITLAPVRPTYIVSEHHIHNPFSAKLLKYMHVITKKMFTPDVSTVRKIFRAKKENAVLVLFPEGRLSCYGHTLPLVDGAAELVKKLGVDVYVWKADGAYLTFPKWRDKGDDRIGKINASVKKLMTSDTVAEKSVDELKRIIENAITHDDELAMEGVEYKCKDMSRGLDKILFKCPKCYKENTLITGENHIRCECGLDATLDSTYRLHNAPFKRINEWFEWQQESIDIDNESLYSSARFGRCKEDGFMDPYAGEGDIYIDKNIFRLSGVMHGEEIEFEIETGKIGAFPITTGEHLDIYHNGELIYIYPLPDPKRAVKWVCFLDKFMAKKKQNTSTQNT